VTNVPAELLAASDALATEILAPPLRHWYRLPADARPAYWALFDAALSCEPGALGRVRSRMVRGALRMANPRLGRVGHITIAGLLTIPWLAAGVGSRIRRLRPARLSRT
jgi:hypothetical protein